MLHTYGRVAKHAQERTNCITELLLPEAEAWLENEVNLKGPLAGIPISLKDSVQVKGFDTTLGYSKLAGKPFAEDGPMVRLLKDAGLFTLTLDLELCSLLIQYRGCPLCQDCFAYYAAFV